jgi:hypothetical protein
MSAVQQWDAMRRDVAKSTEIWLRQQRAATDRLQELVDSHIALLRAAFEHYESYCQQGHFGDDACSYDEFESRLTEIAKQGAYLVDTVFGCQPRGGQVKGIADLKSCIAYVQQIVKENSEQHDAPNSLSADTLREIGAKNPPPPAWFESPEENLF